jgi:hypothetical protein
MAEQRAVVRWMSCGARRASCKRQLAYTGCSSCCWHGCHHSMVFVVAMQRAAVCVATKHPASAGQTRSATRMMLVCKLQRPCM